jgi:hypothetical protein
MAKLGRFRCLDFVEIILVGFKLGKWYKACSGQLKEGKVRLGSEHLNWWIHPVALSYFGIDD